MKCGYCGKILKNDANFCTGCGRSVVKFQSEDELNNQNSHSSYSGAVIALIMLIVILLAGSIFMIIRGLNNNTASGRSIVSNSSAEPQYGSDISSPVSSEEEFRSDPALLGQWLCNDKLAAGYTQSDYGIEIVLTLKFNEQGNFTVNYSMMNTGIAAYKITLQGSYSVENGYFTLNPDLSNYKGSYFDINGTQLSVKYSVNNDTLAITPQDGENIIFTRAN